MPDLKSMLNDPGVTLGDLTRHLDSIPHPQRVAESTALGPKEQRRLWDLAKDGEPLSIEYLVPDDAAPLVPFPFEGKNSLPVFTRFQKVFYRTQEGTIGGYNNQSLSPITGPGYYVAHADESPDKSHAKELAVDYLQVPKSKPPTWPAIRPNEAGLSRFIYANMIDYLRWVSSDVVIGRAYRAGTDPMPNYFVLCRATARS